MTRKIWPWQNVNNTVIKMLFVERGFWIFPWAAVWDQNPISARGRNYSYDAENVIKFTTFVDCGAVGSDWKGGKKTPARQSEWTERDTSWTIYLFSAATFQKDVIALQNPLQFISYSNVACISDVLGLYLVRYRHRHPKASLVLQNQWEVRLFSLTQYSFP